MFERRYFRVAFNYPVEFQILKYNRRYVRHLSSKRGLGVGHDMGEDGLSFLSPYSLPAGMILRVNFELPDSGPEQILAKVIRCSQTASGYLTAVQFLNLHGSRKEKLRTFIVNETKKNYTFLQYL